MLGILWNMSSNEINPYPRKVHDLVPLFDDAIKAAHAGDATALAAALRAIEASSAVIRLQLARDARAKRERSS